MQTSIHPTRTNTNHQSLRLLEFMDPRYLKFPLLGMVCAPIFISTSASCVTSLHLYYIYSVLILLDWLFPNFQAYHAFFFSILVNHSKKGGFGYGRCRVTPLPFCPKEKRIRISHGSIWLLVDFPLHILCLVMFSNSPCCMKLHNYSFLVNIL